ncbi:hypothetical protein EHQ43_17620 [Leptospira bouyouniensis]|uniref:Uncharacterized protein n=1 Tax=Leptospira bouyouniensis TaxID=2484911 RepID=A0A7I0HM17_9LEPT|nr:hypothetical protein [Leptospira bouyouniensis]TGL02178.1 hypothetical protein EHQ43_17620 [Leptospira bouyouniensis]
MKINIDRIIALLAFAFAVYTYYDSQKKVDLVYLNEETPRKIIIAEEKSSIKIINNKTKKQIKNPIYQTRLYLWNRGKEAISKGEQWDPITIDFLTSEENKFELIDASITKKTSNYTFSNISLLENHLLIFIDRFDSNDGIAIDILYTSEKPIKLTLNGKIKGQEIIQNALNLPVYKQILPIFKSIGISIFILLILIFGPRHVFRGSTRRIKLLFGYIRKKRMPRFDSIFRFIQYCFLSGFFIYVFYSAAVDQYKKEITNNIDSEIPFKLK